MEETGHGRSLQNRVVEHTNPLVNRRIMTETEKSLLFYGKNTEQIEGRLNRLENEWDIERVLEVNASIIGLFGLIMSIVFRKRLFIMLPILVLGFLLQHALQGWCPPVPVFRSLGVRTQEEIQMELYALRMLKGDFDNAAEMNTMDLKDRVERVMNLLK